MNDQTTDTQSDDNSGDDWAAAMAEQGAAETNTTSAAREGQADGEFERAKFQDLESDIGAGEGAAANLDVILDIPVTLSMEIGRTEIPIQNLLQLNQGSVVELDRLAGEPMDVLINGTLIAHGEVVVVNEKFGIRLTDVISPSERVRKLR